MNEKKDALQQMFFEMPDTISFEELMEVKGGSIPPICSVAGSGIICPGGGGAIVCNGSAAL